MIVVFGWCIASLGAIGLCVSVGLELALMEPLYLLCAKASAGIMGVGGIILGVKALK